MNFTRLRTSSLKAARIFVAAVVIPWSCLHAQDEDFGLPVNSPQWVSMGGYPGTNGVVRCMVVGPDGKLYVGGSFNTAGTARSFGVARWDGAVWEAISPISRRGYSVHAMAFGPQGDLYVGGSFHDFAEVGALRIARWDGHAWHAMGHGLGFDGPASHVVQSIAVTPGGTVYAAGFFDNSGTRTGLNNIARWDGTQWLPVGDGLVRWQSVSTMVEALLFDANGTLFAGGNFTHTGIEAGSPEVRGVARWDGTAWQPLGSGTGHVASMMWDADGALVVGGEFQNAGGIRVNNIARWDGLAWSAFGPPGVNAGLPVATSQPIRSLALDPDGSVIASGRIRITGGFAYFDVVRWDGTAWQDVLPQQPRNGPVRALCFMPSGDFYVGGDFRAFAGDSSVMHANYIGRWDGESLHRLGDGPNDEVLAVEFDSNGHLIVAGKFQTIGGIEASRIARFDGKRWWPYGAGLNGDVNTLALGPGGVIYAGGRFSMAGDEAANLVAMWNGGRWVSLSGGIQSTQGSEVLALLLAPDGDLYVGGWFSQSVSGVPLSGIGRWSHGHWHDLDGGLRNLGGSARNGPVRDIILNPQGQVMIGGWFTHVGMDGVYRPNIARWDGNGWNAVGPTAIGSTPFEYLQGVYLLRHSPTGVLHAGYRHTTHTNDDVNAMVRLVNNSWVQLGNGFSGNPNAMIFDSAGRIFVGGQLSRTGPSPRHNLQGVAYWDHGRWSSLGNEGLGMGMGDIFFEPVTVAAMATDGRGNLVIGGKFSGSTNGVVSPFLIRTRMTGYGFWSGLAGLPVDRLAPEDRNGPLNLPNLLAYAFGVDPMQADPSSLPSLVMSAAGDDDDDGDIFIPFGAPMMAQGGGAEVETVRFQYQRSLTAQNILMWVEVSDDLLNWQPAEILSSRIVDARMAWERVEIETPKVGAGRFFRVATEFLDDF
jgi:trimeric autotransporter adhesin